MFMRSTGIVRKVDELGRVVLPIEYRRILEIDVRDEVEFQLEDDRLVLKKHEQNCMFCASTKELVTYMGKSVCTECIHKMSEI